MADADGWPRAETQAHIQPVDRKDLAMTSSDRPSSASPRRSRRRLAAIALLSLTIAGAASSAASAEPDTNIQKPGHVSVQ
jgi:hypothetical protein